MSLSLSVSTYLPSFHSCSLPKYTGTGMNLQYLESREEILSFLAYSAESSSRYIVMTVPLSVFSEGSMLYSGVPSQDHFTALAPSFQLSVSMVTFFETMNDE